MLKETLENLSKAEYEKQFRHDFQELGEEIREQVADAISRLVQDHLTSPWNHPEVKYIPSQG